MENLLVQHIEITPGICGGKPRIAGHRVRVQDIVIWHEKLGLSPDEILIHYPQLTLADVHAALAYYFDHITEIEEDLRREDELIKAAQARHSPKLKARLGG